MKKKKKREQTEISDKKNRVDTITRYEVKTLVASTTNPQVASAIVLM